MGSLQFGTFAGIPGELLEAPGGIYFTGSLVSSSRLRLSFCPGGNRAFFRIFYQVAFIVIWNLLFVRQRCRSGWFQKRQMCQIPPPYQILNTQHGSLAALLPLRHEKKRTGKTKQTVLTASRLKACSPPVDVARDFITSGTQKRCLFAGRESGGKRHSNDFATNRTPSIFWRRYFQSSTCCHLSLEVNRLPDKTCYD